MDIAMISDATVFTTVDGDVLSSGWDSDPNVGIGGYIYVRSGEYLVAYLHLADRNPVDGTGLGYWSGKTVTRGQRLGEMYRCSSYQADPSTGKRYCSEVPTIGGDHVHYQIVINDSANVSFCDPYTDPTDQTVHCRVSRVGSCQDGNLLETQPLLRSPVTTGPFTCN
jgi:hypothetical protein